jgi:uncharacterized protein YjbJ (UPF0337 family)
MSVSTDAYTTAFTTGADQARDAAERAAQSWKRTVKAFTDPTDLVVRLPHVDLTEPVARYFEYLQEIFDANRELATRWAELVTSLSGSVRDQAGRVTGVVSDQVDAVADLTVAPARTVDELAHEQAAQAEEAAREQQRQAQRAERAAARQAREQARQRYEGLTKAELSDQLAERGLPKTGNVDELIDRLVDADHTAN